MRVSQLAAGSRPFLECDRPAVVEEIFGDTGAAGLGLALERVVLYVIFAVLAADELEAAAFAFWPNLTRQPFSVSGEYPGHDRVYRPHSGPASEAGHLREGVLTRPSSV